MKVRHTMGALVAGALVFAACGTEDSSSDELVALEQAVTESEQAAAASEDEATHLAAQLTDTQEAREDAEAAVDAAEAERDAAIAAADEEVGLAEAEREAAIAESEALRLQYDPQIREELQAEVDAEVARATTVAIEQYERPINGIVKYNKTWKPVASKQDVLDQVTFAAAPERNKSVEEREAERLAAFAPVNVGEIIKNPNGLAGNGYLMYADIVQYDTNTGVCAFHGNFATEYSSRSYNYDERAQFGYGAGDDLFDAELEQALNEKCPALDGIDVDDHVKVWAILVGSYTYSTASVDRT